MDAFHHCEVERLRDVRKANIRSLLPKDLRAIADGTQQLAASRRHAAVNGARSRSIECFRAYNCAEMHRATLPNVALLLMPSYRGGPASSRHCYRGYLFL